jgi:two-component system LytT family response regulator
VHATPRLELVRTCADGDAALEAIRALEPQLVLLDIDMPGRSGLEVLRGVRDCGLAPAVIFTTAYDEHALTAFELHAADYLLKPFSRERFDEAVNHALGRGEAPPLAALEHAQARRAQPLERILVRDRGTIVPVAVDTIELLLSDTKYTSITSRGRSWLVRLPIASFEEQLDANRFLKLHRGCIVNLDFVESMKPNEASQLVVQMRDGTRITASREVSKKLREQSL